MQTERAVCWGAEFPLAGEADVVWVLWQVPSQYIYIYIYIYYIYYIYILYIYIYTGRNMHSITLAVN